MINIRYSDLISYDWDDACAILMIVDDQGKSQVVQIDWETVEKLKKLYENKD